MHDLIHDLAQYMSRGHYFTLEDGNSKQITMKVHHLVVASHVSDKTMDFVLRTTQLRTLLPSSSSSFDYLSNEAVHQLVSGMKLLRVLSLLANKKKLEELTFSWSRDTEDPEDDKGVLEELLSGTELKRLNIIRYRDMEFPNCFQNPNTISSIVSIKLERCRHCRSLPALGKLPSLKTLYIKQLDGVVTVSKEFYGTNGKSASLESLSFSSMSAWKEWNSTWVGVKDGEVFPKLRELCISDCDRLITVHLPQNLPSLTKLIIPSPLLTSTALHRLQNFHSSACGNLKDIKDAGKSLSLSSLFIKGCPKFISFNEGRLRAPNLNSLTVEGCEKLTKLPGQMPYLLPSLKKLLIINCPQVESFPAGAELNAPDLNSLTVEYCKNLKKLQGRMHDLLPSLERLWILDCPNMELFPEGGLPSKLNGLLVSNCTSLIKNRNDWNL
ncbi:hypothetical protein FEM48_Zijuj10G0009100 [Ziziphus jujuba var. spinosa]|uniref:R13L1/DRL21-like LRR repeat region domain-containing protein n=1 Tax=Ziziphus jujuba var. spinosa TaxID=714518 RepID=A0A978UKB9_ZIZJJ|nr:hypothetical protein FEM48_Zijuj10G0009100 [Ziziphus jujuba var. spinosa]